jgi:predicted PurR-regulated permease PerM
MKTKIHSNIIRQVLLLLVVLGLAFIIIKELFFLLGALLGAITIYVLLRNSMIYLITEKKWNPTFSALLIMFLTFIILILPVAWLTTIVVERISPYIENPNQITSYLTTINNYIIEKTKLNLLNQKNIDFINGEVFKIAQKLLGGTFSVMGTIFMMYFFVYFMLKNAFEVEKWLKKSLPFRNANVNVLVNESKKSIYGSAVGIPIVAIGQAFVAMIGYAIFGVNEWFLLAVITGICSVIPLVGAMIIYLPLAIFMLAQGNTGQGIGLAIWGFVVIGSIDNVIRLFLLKQLNNVHPLITILGVIIGVPLFGFLGVIFGPLILSIFLILTRVYVDEFGKQDLTSTED